MMRRTIGIWLACFLLASPLSSVFAQGDSEDKTTESNGGVIKLKPQSADKEDSKESNAEAEKKDSKSKDESEPVSVPQVRVVGKSPEEAQSAPGSTEVISEKDLAQKKPMNTNEALQMLPGVHVQPEEGMGLRQNIGIRGLNPTRSRKVLVLEDGVPIALGPYGEPEMYYSPPIERMARVEVVKGSGSILFGPQTIGGVINYITPDPPEDFTIKAEGRGGSFGYKMGEVSVGDTQGQVGYWLNVMHQRYEGPRDLNLNLTDVTGKLKLQIDSTQSLELKLNFYDEWSQSTYLGLTTPQYKENPRYNFAENDRFFIRRYALSATHLLQLDTNALLETKLYSHNITRHWRRQDFQRTCQNPDECGPFQRVINGEGNVVTGDKGQWPANSGAAGSGIYYRNSSGNRNREFSVVGIEPALTLDWELGESENELQTGFRLHAEHTRERRINGNHARSVTGRIRDDDERLGRAVAAYALNEFNLLDEKLKLSPGLRFESLWTDRTTFRTRVDGEPTDLNPPAENSDHVAAFIPGFGASYQLLKPLTLFGGVHRGFAPPRTKDAITKEGERLGLEAEYSWNYEIGARLTHKDYLSGQAAGFLMDFQNQIIAPAEAGGAVSVDPEKQDPGSLKAVQGGATLHRGFEVGMTFDPAAYADLSFELPISANYTFVDAHFGDGWSTAIKGNQLPYAPRHKGSARIRFKHPKGWSFQADGSYIGGQYTDKVETVQPSPDGLVGWIDPHFILNAKLSYLYKPLDLTGFVSVKDLLDQRYISSRAPRGIKPGGFRKFIGGLEWKL